MLVFNELWTGGPVFAQAEHFKLSTDSILLADFIRVPGCKKAIDLGCASGIIGLLLLRKSSSLHMTGLEILPEAAAAASENFSVNGLTDRSDVICGDLRDHHSLFAPGSFDLVVSNPPYYPLGSGKISPDPDRASARSETTCTLEDVCSAARYLSHTGSRFCLVGKPDRLCEVMRTMEHHGFEPKRLRFAVPSTGRSPSLFFLEGLCGGGIGLTVEPDLILRNDDGGESDEYKRIYHR